MAFTVSGPEADLSQPIFAAKGHHDLPTLTFHTCDLEIMETAGKISNSEVCSIPKYKILKGLTLRNVGGFV